MKKLLIALIYLFVVTVSFAQGQKLSDLLERANDGDFDAQYQLGLAYMYGDGVPVDCKTALKWFRKAAHQGEPHAIFDCGFLLLGDKCTGEPNYEEALYWFELGDEIGNPDATDWLGVMYHEGLGGLEQNYDKALEYYIRSAEMGSQWGQCSMGLHYRRNISLYQNKNVDYVEAMKWFKLSMDNGNPFAKNEYDELYEQGIRISGTSGAHLTDEKNKDIRWELTEDSLLIISGRGNIHSGIDNMWWFFRDRIQSIRIEEGVTGVIGGAFDEDYPNLEFVYLPNSFETIPEYFLSSYGKKSQINKSILAIFVHKNKLDFFRNQRGLRNYSIRGY